MRILDRYLAKHIIVATGLVLAVLLGLDTFMVFFAEMADIGKNNYTISKALVYVFMHLPFDLYQLFPMAGFLGCLIGLGRLATQSELIIMRSSGVSLVEITLSVIKAAMGMLLAITLVGECIAPHLQTYSEHMKSIALGKAKNYSSLGGIWLREKEQFIHIGDLDSHNSVGDITLFTIHDQQLSATTYAPEAHRIDQNTWLLTHVTQTTIKPGETRSDKCNEMKITMTLDPVMLSLGTKSVDQLSITGLYHSIEYRRQAGLYVEQYEFAFWQRIFQPVATIVMICLGIPFIFGSLRNASMGSRILIGIMIGFIFYILNQFLGPVAIVYQFSPIVAAIIPAIMFITVCFVLFRKIHA